MTDLGHELPYRQLGLAAGAPQRADIARQLGTNVPSWAYDVHRSDRSTSLGQPA